MWHARLRATHRRRHCRQSDSLRSKAISTAWPKPLNEPYCLIAFAQPHNQKMAVFCGAAWQIRLPYNPFGDTYNNGATKSARQAKPPYKRRGCPLFATAFALLPDQGA